MVFICFTGIDGSGKTTHAKGSINYLTQEGHRCTYVWAAHRPVLSYFFYAATKLLGFWKHAQNDQFKDPLELAPTKIRHRINPLWLLFLYIDFQAITLIKVRIPLILGRTVVSDRYVYDLIMELLLLNQYSTGFGQILLQAVPKPDITFLMDVPEHIAKARHGRPLQYLAKRRSVYLKLARAWKFVILDTRKSQAAIEKQTWQRILEMLRREA